MMLLIDRMKIKKLRTEQKVTVEELANLLLITENAYYQKESGRRNFDEYDIETIFNRLGVPTEEWGEYFGSKD